MRIPRRAALLALLLCVGGCDLVYRPEDDQPGRAAPRSPTSYQSAGPAYAAPPPAPMPPVPITESIPGTVTVAPGDQLYRLARAHQISPHAVIAENDLTPPYMLRAGQVLRIPHIREYRAQPGDTLATVAGRTGTDVATLARLNHLEPGSQLMAGSFVILPLGPGQASSGPPAFVPAPLVPAPVVPAPIVASPVSPPPAAPSSPPVAPPPKPPAAVLSPPPPSAETKFGGTDLPPPVAAKPPPKPVAAAVPKVPPAPPAPPVPAPVIAPAASLPPPPDHAAALPEQPSSAVRLALANHADPQPPLFAWPVRGPVVALFGPGAGGTRNEGINIAAAEGADVLAAESGTVTYAGNELKGFGFVVFIRHSGGWVTVYTHNASLLVHQGDHVQRGAVIAKVGGLGNVRGPQLHFELREGTKPVDPLDHLPRPDPDAG